MTEIKKKKLKKQIQQPQTTQHSTSSKDLLEEIYKKEEKKNPSITTNHFFNTEKESKEETTLEEKKKIFDTAFTFFGLSLLIILSLAIANFPNITGYGISAQEGNGLAGFIYLYLEATVSLTCLIAPLSLIFFLAGMYKLKRSIGFR